LIQDLQPGLGDSVMKMKVCAFGFGEADNKLHIANQLTGVHSMGGMNNPSREQLDLLLRDDGLDIAIVNVDVGLDVVRRISHRSSDCKIVGIGSGADPAAVIAAMNAGCSQFVPTPATAPDVQAAVEAVRAAKGMRMSRRVCVVGSSGAAGATTVACHLASEFGALSAAAIVDMDLEFGNVATVFDVEPTHCLASVCRTVEADVSVLNRSITEVGPVAILARPKIIGEIEAVTPEALSSVFLSLSEMFPYVVVDLSRPNGELGQAAMKGADSVVIVVQPNVMSIRNAARAKDAAIAAGVEPNRVKVILNRCDSGEAGMSAKEVADTFDGGLLAQVPNEWATVRKSLDLGHLLPTDSPAGAAMRLAARELVGVQPAEQPRPRKRGLLFRRRGQGVA